MAVRQRRLVRVLAVIGGALILIALFTGLKHAPGFAEAWTRSVMRGWVAAAGAVSYVFPFSVFECCCYALGVWAVVALVVGIRRLCRGRWLEGVTPFARVMAAFCCVLAVYAVVVSPAYYRDPLPMPVLEAEKRARAVDVANAYLEELNELAERVPRNADGTLARPSLQELGPRVVAECNRAWQGTYFHPVRYPAKPMLLSSYAMSQFGTIGVTFGPTGEVNVNLYTATVDLPLLIAHETAHQSGLMREDDADTAAMLAALTSTDPYLRYSALIDAYSDIRQIALLNEVTDLVASSARVRADRAERAKTYAAYSSVAQKVGDFFNDLYLKSSGVKQGTDSYVQQGSVVTTPTAPTPDAPQPPPKREIFYSPIQTLLLYYAR